jgi:alkanesulfonate monooxygenase SsuD/methylene tetrahydromethanopterin reductase-like flavin-dependent oxidoreductase (luciferase family)/predicted kinase
VTIRLPTPSLVVLVGVAGAGKSSWAARWFPAAAVVATDDLRAVVGRDRHDLRATKDAMEVLDLIVTKRLARGLTTVIDSTALDPAVRSAFRRLASAARVPCHAVAVDTPEREARARNRGRPEAVPSAVVTSQLRSFAAALDALDAEGFDGVHRASDGDVELVPRPLYDAPAAARRQEEEPMAMRFGLQIGRFDWPGGAAELAPRLAAVARAAEDAGFASISVMDHVVQIPSVGREWEDMPDSTTTLGFLAASTTRARLGALVHGITYRNIAHLAKITATLDVLSGGRAFCGLGLAWFGREHDLYGWELPPVARRYDMLADALELLPLMWGTGTPPFAGRTVSIPAATCYPRPLQARIPVLVGGSGERRTLRLVAERADACNVFGPPDVVARKVDALHGHCAAVGRDPAAVTVTNLSEAAVLGASASATERAADVVGTVEEHVGRYRRYAEAGVDEAIVALRLDGTTSQVEAFAPVIAAFR